MPSAYQSRPYDDRYSSARMSDLMREAGAVQAQGIQQRGQNTAATIGRMADLVGGAITAGVQAHRQTKAQQELDAKKAEEQRIGDAVKSAIDPATGRLDFGKAAAAIGQIDPLRAEAYWEKADAKKVQEAEEQAKKAAEVARGLGALLLTAQKDKEAGPGALQSTPVAYRAWRDDALKRDLIEPDDFPEEYDEAAVQQQALFKYLPAAAVFNQLFAAKNAPKTTVLNLGDKMVNEQGRTIAENPKPTEKEGTKVVDGRLVTDSGKVVYTSPDAGRQKDPDSGGLTRAQKNAAITARRNEIQRIDELLARGPDRGGITQDEHARMRYDIDLDYFNKTGEDKPAPPLTVERGAGRKGLAEMTPEELNAAGGEPTMRDLFTTQPSRPQNARAPFGAAPAAAAPAAVPKVGDIVMVRGQRVRIVRINRNGEAEGEPVK